MRIGTIARVTSVLVTVVTTQGCSMLAWSDAHSRVSVGPDGLRTFNPVLELDGTPVVCPAFGLVDPVHGILGAAVGAREPVWITTVGGHQLSVIWPAGFTVRFEPTASLYNDKGVIVAAAGQPIELSQTQWDSAAGTFDDPYVASGLVLGGCYPFIK